MRISARYHYIIYFPNCQDKCFNKVLPKNKQTPKGEVRQLQLFYRRPLCFFCFLFIGVSLLAIKLGYEAKLALISVLIFAAVVVAVCAFVLKKTRRRFLYALFALIFTLGGVCSSLIGIDLSQRRAERYVGERALAMSVLETEYTSSYSSAYNVRIESVDSERARVNALLLLNCEGDLSVGDIVYANAEVLTIDEDALGISGRNIAREADTLLICVIDKEGEGLVSHFDREAPIYKQLLQRNGAYAVLSDLKQALASRAQALLGETVGGLARGFLIGDTSDMPTNIVRDFRRSGVSHLLAVSGMHIGIILGVVELLFRKLYIRKGVRCVTVSLLALVLLCLTGFSMSAMRAVIMLWISYVIFLFSEESDPPTVLFLSIFIILLLYPYAVYDIGMWMSFLATLGLVTLYPIASKALPRPSAKRRVIRRSLSLLRSIILVALITVVANMFLLYIMCIVFGEFSLSALPTNILLSGISAVFIFACIAAIAFGGIPMLGGAVCFLCRKLGELIVLITSLFSSFEWSTVSLRPLYARVIVTAFSAALAVMLVIRLKRKLVLAVVPTVFVLIFGVCACVRQATFDTYATYNYDRGNETVCVSDGRKSAIIDLSNGSYESYAEVLSDISDSGAVEINTIAFNKLTGAHLSSMKYILRRQLVRNIVIPCPRDEYEMELCIALAEIAAECGTKVIIDEGVPIKLLDGLYYCTSENGVMLTNGRLTLGYVDVSEEREPDAFLSASDILIFSGEAPLEYSYDTRNMTSVIYSSAVAFEKQKGEVDLDNSYVNIYDVLKLNIRLE